MTVRLVIALAPPEVGVGGVGSRCAPTRLHRSVRRICCGAVDLSYAVVSGGSRTGSLLTSARGETAEVAGPAPEAWRVWSGCR